MTLKEIWEKLGKPEKFVAKILSHYLVEYKAPDFIVVCDQGIKQSCNGSGTSWLFPSLTLAKCHEWAKKVQGGDGFPFLTWHTFYQIPWEVVGHTVTVAGGKDTSGYKYANGEWNPATSVSGIYIQSTVNIRTEEEPKKSLEVHSLNNLPCSCVSVLNGHENGCPCDGLWEKRHKI